MNPFRDLNTHLRYRNNITRSLCLTLAISILFFLQCGGSKKTTVEDTSNIPVSETPELPTQPPPTTPGEAAVETPQSEIIPLVLKTIYFDFDKSEIRSEARAILQENAKVLKAHAQARILIEGHCDERGTVEYNLALGDRRALSVKQYLADLGIATNRITTISYGKEKPVDPARTEAAYAKNRRAEFVIRSK